MTAASDPAHRVPRIGRILDLAGALVFLAGAGLYARSWFGLRAMDAYVHAEGDVTFAAMARADALAQLGRTGFLVMAAGVAIAVVAAVVAKRAARRPS